MGNGEDSRAADFCLTVALQLAYEPPCNFLHLLGNSMAKSRRRAGAPSEGLLAAKGLRDLNREAEPPQDTPLSEAPQESAPWDEFDEDDDGPPLPGEIRHESYDAYTPEFMQEMQDMATSIDERLMDTDIQFKDVGLSPLEYSPSLVLGHVEDTRARLIAFNEDLDCFHTLRRGSELEIDKFAHLILTGGVRPKDLPEHIH